MRRYTVREAAKELGISVSLMYGLLERRLIRHERYGVGRGRYVIPADAIDEYRAKRTIEPAAAAPPVHRPKLENLRL